MDDTQSEDDASDNEVDSLDDEHFDPLIEDINETDWRTQVPRKKTRKRDIVHQKPGLTDSSKNVTSFADSFSLFLTLEVKEVIVRYTNQKGFATKGDMWRILSVTELDAFIGILVAMGANHHQKISVADLWSRPSAFHVPLYAHIMSRDRFKEIFTCIRFDDTDTRKQRQEISRLAAMKEVTDAVRENCVKHYTPSAFLAVDERMVPFRGNCRFRVYMQNKPDKYGLKIWTLADCETWYVKNFDVYLGKVGAKSETNQGQRVVLQLSSCLNSGHNITTDNFFTSFPLAHQLLKMDITLLGTLRQNKRGIPKQLLAKDRKEFTSEFRFTDDLTLVSYVPKKKKVVLVLSSGQPEKRVESSEKKKPLLITAYNETKAAVDIGDKMTKEYTVKRASRRWTLTLFLNLVDICLLNAYVVHNLSSGVKGVRREMHLQLGEELCKPLANARKELMSGIHRVGDKKKPRGKRCLQCEGLRPAKKTATEFCAICEHAVCGNHFSVVCKKCMS